MMFKGVRKGAGKIFERLRARNGQFAFMGGKRKKAGKPGVTGGLAAYDPGIGYRHRESMGKKARRKQAIRWARAHPVQFLKFGAKTLLSRGKGLKAKMAVRNTLATINANIPQGFKNRVKAVNKKFGLGQKASTAWLGVKIVGSLPTTYIGLSALALMRYQSTAEYQAAKRKEQRENPNWRTGKKRDTL